MVRHIRLYFLLTCLSCLSILAIGCASKYEYKAISVRDASSFSNAQHILGLTIGGEAFYNESALKEMFGFNIKKAGMIPVQVVIDNPQAASFTVLASGARLLDENGNWWELLPPEIVSDRVRNYYSGTYDPAQIGKKAVVMAATGAVVGAAVGAASGTNVGEAIGKGAAIGGAIGVASETMSPTETSSPYDIGRDLSNRGIADRPVAGEGLSSGFFYFPAEAKKPKKVRFYVTPGNKSGGKAVVGRKSMVELHF